MNGVAGFDTVLVANRGEIAVRIIRTLHRMGMHAVAVYSDADVGAPHVRAADEAVRLGPAPAADSYLDIDRVVAAARVTGADALHPGYGFLSENPALPEACAGAGLRFIGPPAAALAAMGDKAAARRIMGDAGVPVVPGTDAGDADDATLVSAAADLGPPVIVKPVGGGGGKGMAVVADLAGLPEALRAARRQAAAAFADDRVLLERYMERPRHIEVQVLADAHGTTVHLGERECSLQRRHQKIVEEAPSVLLDDATRASIGASAVTAAAACGYRGAGTVEFIMSAARPDEYFFLEMNTRLQVEHPVTEMVTGLDLVEWQVRVAAGEPLPWTQQDLTLTGHAVEARVYAEDPAHDFLPTGGTVLAYREPSRAGVRVDSGITHGTAVPATYDPLLAKVIAHGADRRAALRALDDALADTAILGMPTNIGFLRRLLHVPAVVRGELDTGLVERCRSDLTTPPPPPDDVVVAAALVLLAPGADRVVTSAFDLPGGWRLGEAAWIPLRFATEGRTAIVRARGPAADAEVSLDDGPVTPAHVTWDGDDPAVVWNGRRRVYTAHRGRDAIWIGRDGDAWRMRTDTARGGGGQAAHGGGPVVAPMPGIVTEVRVRDGDAVIAGQALVVMEAMKMHHRVAAPTDGVVRGLSVDVGDHVEIDRTLLVVDADGGAGS